MTQATGSRSQLVFWEESAFGVLPGSPTVHGLRFTSESLATEINKFESEEIRSDRMVQTILGGNIRPAGDINWELSPEGLNTLLKHGLGIPVSTTGSGPYTHVIEGTNALPVSFGVEKGFTDIDQYFRFYGCRINQFTLTFPQEGLITGTYSIIARQPFESVTPLDATPTYAGKDPYTSYEATLYVGDDQSNLVAVGVCTQIEMTVENNIRDDQFVIGSRYRYNAPEGKRRVTGNFTVFFEDREFYDAYIQETQRSLRIIVNNGVGDSHTIDLPQLQYAGSPAPTPQIPDDGPITLSVPFQTERYAPWNTDIRVTVVNDESSI